ncbi:hypothetical protein DICPUDRAFT_149898 [Dictyostelium purpureum]|uniref:Uncharacterized protein n=1 Tax=Dictyostelium purpureum TaxID=5786 RepID=F0ZEY2_DICPU|nr:uncharacterized protein DICPUDRAFT_149898 [Dictyostelium purpureum]EGC37485.1 hypothetical protein DICPUDRAFT_149898 [Dictyostelium purpureum]|eukprot:XP_003285959.1 hypothetical protein DICPUDRAFT_149898 [Dictyostelium purpureum]
MSSNPSSSYTPWVSKSISSNSLAGLSSSPSTSNRSTTRGADKEAKLLGYLQKQSKSQLPNSNVKLYKKKWFWFEPDTGTLYYSTTSSGALSQPLTPTSLSERIKSIPIVKTTHIEQSISFRLEFIITNEKKTYSLRGIDETSILNWVNTLNQWKKANFEKSSLSVTGSIENPNFINQLGEIELILSAISLSNNNLNNNNNSNNGNDSPIRPLLEKFQPDQEQIKLISEKITQKINYLKSCQNELFLFQQQQQQQNSNSNINNISNLNNSNNIFSNSLLKRLNSSQDLTNSSNSITMDDSLVDDDEDDDVLLSNGIVNNEISDIFSLLPVHLSLYVFSYLEPNDLLICAQVSTQWQKLANDNLLWIRFVFHLITPASVFDKSHNWKSVYLANTPSSKKKEGANGKEKYMNRTISMYGVTPLTSTKSLKEGWLYKRGDDILRIWKKRASVSTRKNCFKIIQSKYMTGAIQKKRMPYYLASDREDDCIEWFSILSNAIKLNTQHQGQYGVVNIGQSNTLPNGISPIATPSKYNQYHTVSNINSLFSNNNNNNNSHSSGKPRKSHKKSFSSSSTSSNNNTLFDSNPQHLSSTPVNLTPIYPMFGLPITKIIENQSAIASQQYLKVPYLLHVCLSHILEKGIREEGIFRVSGSLREIQELQEDFEQGRDIDLNQHDIHAISGLVKTFFRKLPHSLVPSDLDEYSTSVQLATSQTEDEKIQEFKFIFESITPNSFHIFKILLLLLKQIVLYESQNKMTIENLLIVIMPTLKCSPVLITNGIKYYEQIFNQ